MRDLQQIIQNLQNTPDILSELIHGIPEEKRSLRRIQNSWTIHEWACHLIQAQDLLQDRFVKFELGTPIIKAYLPDFEKPLQDFEGVDLGEELKAFHNKRKNLLDFCKNQEPNYWTKPGDHEEYELFNPYILLRHTHLVDHVHLFNIEKLWLTKDSYLK